MYLLLDLCHSNDGTNPTVRHVNLIFYTVFFLLLFFFFFFFFLHIGVKKKISNILDPCFDLKKNAIYNPPPKKKHGFLQL